MSDENIIRPNEFLAPIPKEIERPCDAGLKIAIEALETQLGTFEAYNRLNTACRKMRQQIYDGKIKEQNPIFRKSITGA